MVPAVVHEFLCQVRSVAIHNQYPVIAREYSAISCLDSGLVASSQCFSRSNANISFANPEPVSLFVPNIMLSETVLSKYFSSKTSPAKMRNPGALSPTALIALTEVEVSRVSRYGFAAVHFNEAQDH
jgi:hypothetical protein